MKQSSVKMYPVRSNRASMKTSCLWSTTAWTVALATIMALALFGYGVGYGWQVPREQPAQMRSQVDYDPNLAHPFFESNEWSYEDGTRAKSGKRQHGRDAPLKHTARCFSTSRGVKHRVRFCGARLRDRNRIDLFIHESNPNMQGRVRSCFLTFRLTTQYSAHLGLTARGHRG